MLEPEPIDLLDLLPLDIAPDGERLVAALERQDDGLGQTRVGNALRQTDSLHLWIAGQFDLPGLDDQHIGPLGDVLEAERSNGRATSVMTAPGFTFMMSSTFLPAPEVAVTMTSMSAMCSSASAPRGPSPAGLSRSISSLSASSFAGSMETSQSSSAAIASSRAHTEPMAPVAPTTIALPLMCPFASTSRDTESADRVVGGPQRTRGAVGVARGYGKRCALGHRDTGVADDFGERAEAHDLSAQLLGHVGRREQPRVGELRIVGHQFFRGAADRDEPALDLGARR